MPKDDDLDDEERELLRKHREQRRNKPVRVREYEIDRKDAIRAGIIPPDDDDDDEGGGDDAKGSKKPPSSGRRSFFNDKAS